MKIEELGLSVRTYNRLKRLGIDTVEQFQEKAPYLDAVDAFCLGDSAIQELYEKFGGLGKEDHAPLTDYVVSRDCFDRVLAENDVMRAMLAKIGKKPGDSMNDVRLVVRSSWRYNEGDNIPYCDNCGVPQDIPSDFCPSCGADMREES